MNNQSQFLLQTIHINNEGVSLIKNGDFQLAITHLSIAFKSCHQIMRASGGTNLTLDDSSSCSLHQCMLSSPAASNGNTDQHHDDSGSNDATSCLPSYIYRRPIHIPTSSSSEYPSPACTTPSTSVVCVIIIFNLALAYQLCAVDETSLEIPSRQCLLQKAIRFYNITQDLLRTAKSEDTDLFVLAVINNLGQAHQALGESDIAEAYFQCLLSLLQRVVSCGSDNNDPASNYGLSDQLEGFFGSTIHFMLSGTITAAAA